MNDDSMSAAVTELLAEIANPLVILNQDKHGKWITFRGHEHYEISLNRIDTPEKLLGWIAHLCDKRWVTPRTIQCLIAILEGEGIHVQHSV